jgi:hypothetical protein
MCNECIAAQSDLRDVILEIKSLVLLPLDYAIRNARFWQFGKC